MQRPELFEKLFPVTKYIVHIDMNVTHNTKHIG